MRFWNNIAASPSRLDKRPEGEVVDVLRKLGVPDCGLQSTARSINKWKDLPDMSIDHYGASVGPLDFHPVMEMSYRKNGIDYVQTTITAEGVSAKAKYVGVFCGKNDIHIAFVPRCGNVASLAEDSSSAQYLVSDCSFNSVPAPGTLFLLAAFAAFLLKKYR